MDNDDYSEWLDCLDFVIGSTMFGKIFEIEDIVDELQGIVDQIYCMYFIEDKSHGE